MRVYKLMLGVCRRWFRQSLRRRLRGKAVRRKGGEASLYGYGIRMHYPDELIWLNQILEIYGSDCYEVHKLPEVCRVIDGGANIGAFSLYVKWRRPQAEIVAIEPSALNLKFLYQNFGINNAGDINVVPAALGSSRGDTKLSAAASDAIRAGADSGEVVSSVRLEDIIQEPVDLLKLDIEGSEFDVVCTAGDILKKVHRVVIEYHLYPGDRSKIPEILVALRDQSFSRFQITSLRDYRAAVPSAPMHCCLVHAWRA
jgi:FkbM family methyltransferase